jgi:hypothetical protein
MDDRVEQTPEQIKNDQSKQGETKISSGAPSPIEIEAKNPEEKGIKEKEMVDKLIGIFEKWEGWRRPFERVWNEIYRLYFSAADKHKTPTRSLITVPIAFQLIESALPKIVNTIFSSQEEFFEVQPTDPDDVEFATVIQTLLTYQLAQADFFIKFIDFTKQLLMYGTSYFKVYWKVRRKWVWTRTPKRRKHSILGFQMGEVLEWEDKKEYKVVEKRPELDVLDILDVYPDPEARTEKEAAGVFIRSWINIDDLREMGKGQFPIYANTEREDLKPDRSGFMSSRNTRSAVRGTSNPSVVDPKSVEVIEFWGSYDVDGDGIKEEAYVVIANRRILLKASANPFYHQKRPIVRAVLFPIPGEWYGLGLIEPVISNIHELWTLRRQRMDNVNMVINRMWKVNSMADIDLDTLVSGPNNIIITDDMNGVEVLDTPNITQTAYQESAALMSEIEDATVPRSVQGTPQSGKLGRTARGAQMIISQALEKFGSAIKLIEEMGIKRVLRMFHQLNLQFIDNDDVLQDPGLYGSIFEKQITPEMIRAEVEFKMQGISDMVGKEGKINQVISFMGVFGKVLSANSITELAKKVWSLMGFNKSEIELQGVQAASMEGNVLDPNITQAVIGQTQNQGASAPPAIPGANNPHQG